MSVSTARIYIVYLSSLLIFGFLVSEFVVRVFKPESALSAQINNLDLMVSTDWSVPDKEFHHVGPGINSPPLSELDQPSTLPRVLVVGDSFVQGLGAEPGLGVAALLKKQLDSSLKIVPFGISSHSPIIYRNVVRRAFLHNRWQAVVVLVDQTDLIDDFVYEVDRALESSQFDVEHMNARKDVLRRSVGQTVELLKDSPPLWRQSALVNFFDPIDVPCVFPKEHPDYESIRLAYNRRDVVVKLNERGDFELARRATELLFRNLDDIVEQSKSKDTRVLMIANPWQFQVTDSAGGLAGYVKKPFPHPNRLEQMLSTHFKDNRSVSVLPVTEEFRKAALHADLYNHVPPQDIHWGNAGHALAKDLIVRALTQ